MKTEVITLGEICDIKSSKRIYQSEYVDSGVPFYRGKEISELSRGNNPRIELYIDRERYNELKIKFGVPKKDDLLITSVGTIGNTWVSDGREFYYKDGNITQIVSNENINTKFISYLFSSDIIKKQYQCSGTAQAALTIEKLNKIKIPLLPLEQQAKIVDVLDKAQELIDKRKEQIEACDELVKSRFVEMFGDPYLNDKGFVVETINDVCSSIVRGPFGSALKKEFFVKQDDSTYKVYEQKNAIQKNAQIGEYHVTREKYEELKRFECVAGDILMSCSGTMGEFYQLPNDCERGIINQALCKFTLNNKILPIIFLTYMKQTIGNLETKGSGIKNIASVVYVKAMPGIIPPMELQNQFADFVKQVDKLKFEMEQSLKELEDNFNSLMQRAFKGELFN